MPNPISWDYVWPWYLAALAFGYLLGSIPFGLVLTKLAGLGDIRSIGSGNIGATNVLRTGHKGLAAATLLLDGGKGAAAALIAYAVAGPTPMLLAAFGAVIGHMFPVWLGFKGGKGMATALGVLLAVAWPVGVLACLTWLAVAAVFRMSSLASLVAIAVAPVAALILFLAGPDWAYTTDQVVQLCVVVAVLVWIKHRENIARLLSGTEPRIGAKK